MKDITQFALTATALISILILATLAITHDVNGYTLALALTALAGLGGYTIGRRKTS